MEPVNVLLSTRDFAHPSCQMLAKRAFGKGSLSLAGVASRLESNDTPIIYTSARKIDGKIRSTKRRSDFNPTTSTSGSTRPDSQCPWGRPSGGAPVRRSLLSAAEA